MSTRLREPAPEKTGTADRTAACQTAQRSRRRFRRATIVLGILIAIPLLVALGFVLGINPVIRKTGETLGSDALGLPVAIRRVRVNIAGGVHLYQLAVGNPLPFREVRSFRLGRMDAAVTLPSLFRQTVEVEELLLVNPEVIVEFEGDKTNWGAIFDHLVSASKAPKESEGRMFIIHRIRITHPVVIVHAKEIPKGIAIHLRDIELGEVGTGPGAASPTAIVLATIFQALLTGAVDEWTGAPGELGAALHADVTRGARPFEGKLVPAEKKK